ncbi:hypothetical protein [Pelomonas sp. SE-A7]|uniref:hypothetical protein n=1 Tax=Pelomonas sp. SE-A7 TaxID=3054953 RepID=UPI00259C9FA6|nr:hypothetical protein [Pelomonas sp. SE-A7]MDM4767093.1 hypothetical protein [Pelomonas sp. SE-A7]
MKNPLLNDPELRRALREQALREAEALRREALDDFWRGADALLSTATTTALRSARRLAHRLQRRTAATP